MMDDLDRSFWSPWNGGAEHESRFAPPVDIAERDGNVIVSADLPGLSQDDVKVEITGDTLCIQGERKREHEEETRYGRRTERSYGQFCRYISLPEGAKTEQARAQFSNGVLEVSIPVDEQKRPRQIPISAASGERKAAASESQGQQQKTKAV